MKPRWRKVLHDLFDNKARTLLVVFSIAVGVFSIGVIAGAYQIISNDMSVSYSANVPANIELRMSNFNEDVLDSIHNQENVQDAEGRRVFNMRVRVPGTEKWTTLDMVAFDSFEKNAINLLVPIKGESVPRKRELLLELDALEHIDVGMGGLLEFQLPDGSLKTLPVTGIVQDTAAGAGDFLAAPFGYITMDTLQYLGQPRLFNRALVTVSGDGDDLPYIREVGAQLKDKIEKSGTPVIRSRFSETHEHPLASTVNAILGILMALGVLIVFLSSSLIANTLSALLNQHLRHIGVIKLVGGQRRQVFRMYLALIMAFGIIALAIAIPSGGFGAYGLAEFIAGEMNFNLLGNRIIPMALLIQIAVGLLVPLIAGLVPVMNGSRITVLRALSGGLAEEEQRQAAGGEVRLSRFDRMQVKVMRLLALRGIHIPRPFVISLRNTFRRKGRLALTLFTLTMGGAIFISVFNVRVTLHDYIGQIGKYFRADVTLDFDVAYRLSEVNQFAMQMPGVEHVEGWQFVSAELLGAGDEVIDNLNILAPPAQTELVKPLLVSGRFIHASDVRKLAISEAVLDYLPDLQVGDTLRLKLEGREETWEVIGIFKFVGREGILAYAPLEYIEQVTNLTGRSFSFRVVTEKHDRADQDAIAEELDRFFRDKGFKVRQAQSGSASLDTAVESLDTLVIFLLIMAILTAIVGSMGLTGTMGMNVLERTREIGIMRAIGADDRAVMRTVIAEGVVIGSISFVLAVIFSVPFTYLLSTIVSLAVFQTPIDVVFTYLGYAIWLGLVLLLSTVASILPARNAARLTIREVLAYE
ncbi:MAG TPA: FtsX-like permease family protein [Anaerolineales bacterium]|nr:FtsX-like permease family protein [Anaerolineales bacterium]